MKYIQPIVFADSFTCPNCGVLSKQEWRMKRWYLDNAGTSIREHNPIRTGQCQHCNKFTLWINEDMYYPDNANAPFPNPDMPDTVMKLYLEAAAISTKSPRGAAALLRLAIQVLCRELGEPGENINTDIRSLVKKGLPEIVQKSLDIVRVTGNDAVHPGQIDTDNPEIVRQLFDLTNVIIEYMISLPSRIGNLYNSLPAEKIKGIENRDK